MTNLETYKQCFVEGLELDINAIENASMESVDSWDSIGQMSLIALVEDAFNIELDPDEIMSFVDYNSGIQVLKNHNIEF